MRLYESTIANVNRSNFSKINFLNLRNRCLYCIMYDQLSYESNFSNKNVEGFFNFIIVSWSNDYILHEKICWQCKTSLTRNSFLFFGVTPSKKAVRMTPSLLILKAFFDRESIREKTFHLWNNRIIVIGVYLVNQHKPKVTLYWINYQALRCAFYFVISSSGPYEIETDSRLLAIYALYDRWSYCWFQKRELVLKRQQVWLTIYFTCRCWCHYLTGRLIIFHATIFRSPLMFTIELLSLRSYGYTFRKWEKTWLKYLL